MSRRWSGILWTNTGVCTLLCTREISSLTQWLASFWCHSSEGAFTLRSPPREAYQYRASQRHTRPFSGQWKLGIKGRTDTCLMKIEATTFLRRSYPSHLPRYAKPALEMSSGPPHSSPDAPHLAYSNPDMPRRTSYASVAAGTAGTPHQTPSVHLPPAPSQVVYQEVNSEQPARIRQQVSSDQVPQGDGGILIPETWGSAPMASMPSFSYPRFLSAPFNASGVQFTEIGRGAFVSPSYLRGSKHMEDLEEYHKANMTAQTEEPAPPRSGHGSLSKSSSTVSLPKMQASHRGMAYEIIEHQPAVVEPGPAPLPSKWVEVDKHNSIEIAGNGLQIRYIGTSKLQDHEAAAARTDHPMPPQCGIYYYEVFIESKGKDGMIGVGFSAATASLEKLPGWEQDSWAYHGDDGKTFCCQLTGKPFGPTFSSGDTIGCGIDFPRKTAFFTKNGHFLSKWAGRAFACTTNRIGAGHAFRDIKTGIPLYPSVGMKRPHAHLVVNFGQRPFIFDIDTMVERQKEGILGEINSADTSIIHPTLDKEEICKALVAQYLSHDGYVATGQAFAEEVRRETTALKGTPESPIDGYLAVEEDHDAVKRQRQTPRPFLLRVLFLMANPVTEIRAAILEGDIDTTLQLTNTYFPQVLSTCRDINFRIRCRKYIEMMRQSAELLETPSPCEPVDTMATNGDAEEMDLDEDHAQGGSGDQGWENPMESSEMFSRNTRYDDMINQAIAYGQELNHEFKDETDPQFRDQFKETMRELFGMLAYKDARNSPAARWLEVGERAKVAEGLNSAILLSLGKSSSTALETIYKQTVVFTDMISEDGGIGSLVNVRHILTS
ncbi:MAG: hypothetical protein Q9163_001251 [Psora crenata]